MQCELKFSVRMAFHRTLLVFLQRLPFSQCYFFNNVHGFLPLIRKLFNFFPENSSFFYIPFDYSTPYKYILSSICKEDRNCNVPACKHWCLKMNFSLCNRREASFGRPFAPESSVQRCSQLLDGLVFLCISSASQLLGAVLDKNRVIPLERNYFWNYSFRKTTWTFFHYFFLFFCGSFWRNS